MTDGVVYRIAKWSEIFETADSRRHKALHWISVPIGFESNGFAKMIEDFGDDAPALYGAWIALAKIAATCPIRGILSTSRGDGLTVGRLSFLSHFPRSCFEKLIDWASQESVCWLEKMAVEEVEQLLIEQQSSSNQSPNELPDQTRQDQTKPNLTQPDNPPTPQGESSVVGRRLDLSAVDQEAVNRLCKRVHVDLPFEIDRPELGQLARIALAAGVRSVFLDASRGCCHSSIRSKKKWF
ncbi:MAG TPA: hypothetical protein PKD54_07605, partial [Pirellulaceae bacterium]|nr:hypothetical protein [Pirellulaceae bacterium]